MAKGDEHYRPAWVDFCMLLTIALFCMRLAGVIDTPLLWVLSPLWIPVAGMAALAIVGAVIAICAKAREQRK